VFHIASIVSPKFFKELENTPLSGEHKNDEQLKPHYEKGIPILPTPADHADAERAKEKKGEREYKTRQISIQVAMLWTQIALAGFGIAAFGAAYYQAQTARESADQARATTNLALDSFEVAYGENGISERTMRQIVDQTAAQIQSAKAAEIGIRATRDQMRLEQRAWVSMDGPITIDYLQLVPRLVEVSHFGVKNYGRGPAFKVIVNGWFDTDGKYLENESRASCSMAMEFSSGSIPTAPKIPKPPAIGYTLFPGQPHDENIGSPGDPWQGEALPNLKHFWFVGCISYLDQFRVRHWTSYCMEPKLGGYPIDKNIPLQYCSRFNDTDDEDSDDKRQARKPN